MNEAIKERISALSDGELSEFEVRRVLEEINNNPELREYWKQVQLIKSGLSDQPLGFKHSDISRKVANELGKSIEDLGEDKNNFINYRLALAACLTFRRFTEPIPLFFNLRYSNIPSCPPSLPYPLSRYPPNPADASN